MSKFVVVGAALLMLVAGGAVEIIRSGRTANDQQISEAREKFASIPMTIGEWKGTDVEFDAKQLAQAEAAAHIYRRYVREVPKDANAQKATKASSKTGGPAAHKDGEKEEIYVLMLAGSPKAIGAHDPTVCYGGAGFKQQAAEMQKNVTSADGKADSFWSANFETDAVAVQRLNVLWAWTATDGRWAASSAPRIDYAREPLLYKIYVSRLVDAKSMDGHDPSEDFLREMTRETRRALALDVPR